MYVRQVFYLSSISALSEPIAALILIALYYAYEKQQYILNALLLSFGLRLPRISYCQCTFGLIYLKKRNFKCILLFSVFGLIRRLFFSISGDSPWIIVIYYTVINEIEAPAATNLIFLGNRCLFIFLLFSSVSIKFWGLLWLFI